MAGEKILIVDSNLSMLHLAEDVLSKDGYLVKAVSSNRDAMALTEEGNV